MPRTLRSKLLFIVAVAASALVLLLSTGALVASRVEHQLSLVQRRYLPKLELGPALESQFEHIARSLQDAVAAQDAAALNEVARQKSELNRQLMAAEPALSTADVVLLQSTIDDYYALALDVSRRLIAGETGEQLLGSMSLMQAKQARTLEMLRKAVAFDRSELRAAFAAVTRTEREATLIRLAVSLACLLVVSWLSFWLSRGTLRSLSALAAGFERFGRSEFERPIMLGTRDELGELAERANRMAESLRALNQERDRADWLKSGHARLVHELRGELEPGEVAERALAVIARHLQVPVGALYYEREHGRFELVGGYGLPAADGGRVTRDFELGQGILGQAAKDAEISFVRDLPPEHLPLESGLGRSAPNLLVLAPLVQLGRVTGVLELGCVAPWPASHTELLNSVRETIAISLEVARARVALHTKNRELDAAHKVLEKSAAELTTVSAYKTQFLANMSHELRTPLNSMLLLSRLLSDNEANNLTDKQVEYCRTIHSAGKDLLALINQVLDLAKIEAGKQRVQIEQVELGRFVDYVQRVFAPVARDKGLDFQVELAPGGPPAIATDPQRVEQILNNLIGNAIKFTPTGQVKLRIGPVLAPSTWKRPELRATSTIELRVEDTGVGIAPADQERIFAPFEQADGAGDRRFGGTGLGLTIARELAGLLGGELTLQSELGRGTTFVCYLPYDEAAQSAAVTRLTSPRSAPPAERAGSVLIVEDDGSQAHSLSALLESQEIEVERAANARAAVALLDSTAARRFSCMVLDLGLPDMDGLELLETLSQRPGSSALPVVVYTGRALSRAESERLNYFTDAVVLKGNAGPTRVVDEVRLFTQRFRAGLRPSARHAAAVRGDLRLEGRRVLVADDDMRTVYAVSALLRARGAEVFVADTGRSTVSTLESQPVDALLLDLTIPELDGFGVLRWLHNRELLAELPVIVLTAKVMQGDRQKCLDAGASDYLAKPVDGDSLIETLHRLLSHRVSSAAARRTVN